MIYITRKEHFNAAHKLYNSNFSHEKNLKLYGICSNENWHGHNYDLIVTVKGNINSEKINIKKTADIEGVLNQKILSIEEGAILKIKTETYK